MKVVELMAVNINTNLSSLFAQKQLNQNQSQIQQATQRLSSGLRINTAKDDAAGLAISQRLTAQISGMSKAIQSANDSISIAQLGESALGSISDQLQRVRELAVQAANGVTTESDRQSLQEEVNANVAEIKRIGKETAFNGTALFQRTLSDDVDRDEQAVVDGLFSHWLEQSEKMIYEQYGLKADGSTKLHITIREENDPDFAAYVTGTGAADGKVENQVMVIDMEDFRPANLPNGGTEPFYNDRIIAHEMVHAVMGRTMNFTSLPEWFQEGAAELIHGADERLSIDIDNNGGGAAGINAVVAANGAAWDGSSLHYSSAYTAVRYMHEEIKNAGGDGIKDIMTYLNENQTATLDDALMSASSGAFASVADFQTQYSTNGAAFIQSEIDLTNEDTGAIGGLDADNGEIQTAESIIDDTEHLTDKPLEGFQTEIPVGFQNPLDAKQYTTQVGANRGQVIDFGFKNVSLSALGLGDVDVVNHADEVIAKVDEALEYINSSRAELGAKMNRMAAAISVNEATQLNSNASRSRILDADYAQEASGLTKSQILQQASASVFAQANASSQLALSLLG